MASYFNHNNTETTRLREKLAEDSLDMLIQWLKDGGNVGIHGRSLDLHVFFCSGNRVGSDATNSTRSRRCENSFDNCRPHYLYINDIERRSKHELPKKRG